MSLKSLKHGWRMLTDGVNSLIHGWRLLTDYERGKLINAAIVMGCVIAAIITIILALLFPSQARAEEITASYYTAASCQREGTSGIYTASGERYDETALTCAMRSREWGAKYRVTNLDNDKFVIVRLNDFGPNKKLWTRGRKMDLSKGAFQKIANLKKGVIRVKIERI